MKIVIDNKIPFIKGALEPYADVVYLPGKETTADVVRDADALITRTRTICNESLLSGSKVRAIATATIGFDHIDTGWVEENGIFWTNAPGCNSASVKQYISSVLVNLARIHSLNLEGMTLGVVGVGNVGSKVAVVGRALGMKVLLNDPPRARKEGPEGFVSLDEIISGADIISVHVPLEKDGPDPTFHLFDAARIARLGNGRILINSSRGPVVDNVALKEALKRHALKGAVLDVWEKEPELDRELLGLLDLATPHIAGYSADGKACGTMMSVRAIAARLGLPLEDWTPSGVPAPTHGSNCGPEALDFTIDAVGRTEAEVLAEAILHCYDASIDCEALRSRPEDFEALRGDYPVRREPSAYTLRLKGAGSGLAGRLEELGFKTIMI